MSAAHAVSGVPVMFHGTGGFSWTRFELHPSVLIGCVLLAALYLAGAGPLRRRHGWAERVHPARAAAFLSGVAVIFLALNGPIHDLSDNFLFSAHMLQHMLLMLVMPALLLLGLPAWLVRPLLGSPAIERTARWLTHPAVAFVLYNVVFIAWHLPRFYNWALENHDVHVVQHLMFMAAATLMWWPVVNPVPELERLPRGPLQMLYLFAFAIPASIVSAFITLSERVIYPWYAEAPRVFELSALDDQRLGGLIMWIPGMLIFWIAISAVFFRWVGSEIREWRREAALP
ncbi:MAG: cytochrome c oxidase assembly protein [Gemmatimonadetes bacterium]|nr:cytochrome c oxidase assembly protein [Gemmatimonadota bacterium]